MVVGRLIPQSEEEYRESVDQMMRKVDGEVIVEAEKSLRTLFGEKETLKVEVDWDSFLSPYDPSLSTSLSLSLSFSFSFSHSLSLSLFPFLSVSLSLSLFLSIFLRLSLSYFFSLTLPFSFLFYRFFDLSHVFPSA
jgi:hypothetical protein